MCEEKKPQHVRMCSRVREPPNCLCLLCARVRVHVSRVSILVCTLIFINIVRAMWTRGVEFMDDIKKRIILEVSALLTFQIRSNFFFILRYVSISAIKNRLKQKKTTTKRLVLRQIKIKLM